MNKLVLFGLFSLLMIHLFCLYDNYKSLDHFKTTLIFKFEGNNKSLKTNNEYSSMLMKAMTQLLDLNSDIRLLTTFSNSQLNIDVNSVSVIDPEKIKLIANRFVFDLNNDKNLNNDKKGNPCANDVAQFYLTKIITHKQEKIRIIDLWISICLIFSTWLWFRSILR